MKITREKLLRLSESYVKQRAVKDRSIICAYLSGSMLKEFPFINMTTDVDIIMMHVNLDNPWREIVAMAEEVTLDIYHYPKELFSDPRALRSDPWLGSSLCFDPYVLYGKGHWFEFILASTEASFFLPEYVIRRSQVFLNEAHRCFSMLKQSRGTSAESTYVYIYLQCIENAINAIASLSDHPLTLRHFIQDMNMRCESAGNESLPEMVINLLEGKNSAAQYYQYFYSAWKYYLEYFSQYTNSSFYCEFYPTRLYYYLKPVEGLWDSHLPSALWIVLYTWSIVLYAMKCETNEPYHALCSLLEIGPKFFDKREVMLDSFIDTVDEVVDNWAKQHGITDATNIYTGNE